jgi:hypothetical protein
MGSLSLVIYCLLLSCLLSFLFSFLFFSFLLFPSHLLFSHLFSSRNKLWQCCCCQPPRTRSFLIFLSCLSFSLLSCLLSLFFISSFLLLSFFLLVFSFLQGMSFGNVVVSNRLVSFGNVVVANRLVLGHFVSFSLVYRLVSCLVSCLCFLSRLFSYCLFFACLLFPYVHFPLTLRSFQKNAKPWRIFRRQPPRTRLFLVSYLVISCLVYCQSPVLSLISGLVSCLGRGRGLGLGLETK